MSSDPFQTLLCRVLRCQGVICYLTMVSGETGVQSGQLRFPRGLYGLAFTSVFFAANMFMTVLQTCWFRCGLPTLCWAIGRSGKN